MNRIIFLTALILGLCASCMQAQRVSPNDLRVFRESASGGAVNFFVENRLRKNYHITVRFTMMTGYVCNCQLPFSRNVTQGRTLLFTLRPRESVGSQNYQFTWGYYEGVVTEKLNEKVEYLLPVADGRQVRVIGLEELGAYLGVKDSPEGYYALGFGVEKDEVIHAIRKGRVTKIVDLYEEDDKSGLTFSNQYNYMTITHEDGSNTRYSVLKKGGFKVEELDFVNAGDPIAVASGDNYRAGPQVRISTTYLSWDKREPRQKAYKRRYAETKFTTKEGSSILLTPGESYTSVHSEELITQEMTKREKKARKKKKG